MSFSKAFGSELLQITRKTVHAAFSNRNYRMKPDERKRLSMEAGVFVNIYRKGELRGSFGYPPGTMPLADAIRRAARGAAFMDPRFQALSEGEFNNVKFEVVLVSKLQLLKVKKLEDYLRKINPKRDGLYVEYGPFKAMQLPMFAARRKFSARDYLEKTVEKAGLAPEMWRSRNLNVYTFTTERFSE